MKNTNKIVGLGLFSAIVVVLQLLGSFIKFGTFSVTLVLVPIVVGAALYGVGAGCFLGLVFGATVLISGDAALFLTISPFGTVLVVLLKGALAGLCAGLVYKAVAKKNNLVAVILAAIVCPVVNTGVFFIGCNIFFMDAINGWAKAAGFSGSGAMFVIATMIGFNFLFEIIANIILSPVAVKLINIGKKQLKKD